MCPNDINGLQLKHILEVTKEMAVFCLENLRNSPFDNALLIAFMVRL